MANINIKILRDDVKDRLDNEVLTGSLPENLKKKAVSIKRITKSINNALSLFVSGADPSAIAELITTQALVSPAIQGNLSVYNWPTASFTARPNGGLLKVVVNGIEMDFNPNTNPPLEGLRYQAGSSFYGDSFTNFHVDLMAKRVYAPKSATVGVVFVSTPLEVTDGNTYNLLATLPINDIYYGAFSDLVVMDVKKSLLNFSPAPAEDNNE